MTDLFNAGKQALAAQPFSRLLEAELIGFSAELVELIPITEQTTAKRLATFTAVCSVILPIMR